jgi:hypothetical protein
VSEKSGITDAFSEGCAEIRAALLAFPPSRANEFARPGGWSRKQVLGHMLDSAANNHQRFVRAILDGAYSGPIYDQDGWVELHGYSELPWEALLQWWIAAHEILKQVVARVPEERLNSPCVVGDDAPVSLRFLIEDYVDHQRHHLAQILR